MTDEKERAAAAAAEPGFYWIQWFFQSDAIGVWSEPVVAQFEGDEWRTVGSEEIGTSATPYVVLSERLTPPERRRP